MRLKKGFMLSLALLLLFVTACTSNTNNEASGEEVTLKIMLPGDRSQDMDKVFRLVEEKMKEDGLNIKLDVVFIPWSDLDSKTQVALAAGEEIDLIYDAPWLHINQMVAAGHYTNLESLLEEYGPSILARRSELSWEANKINGEIMAIPMITTMGGSISYHIRKDIREKLGFDKLENEEQLIEFMYAVKEKEPNLIPFTSSGHAPDQSFAHFRLVNTHNYSLYSNATPRNFTIYTKGNESKAYNLFDDMIPELWDFILEARQLYEDGIINSDLMASPDGQEMLNSGKAAVIVGNGATTNYTWLKELQTNVPGADLELLTVYDFVPKANTSLFNTSDLIAVPVTSKHKKEAIQFLNWANESKENYDLISYGIEGEHWEAIGDKQIKILNDAYRLFNYAWVKNTEFERVSDQYTPEEVEILEFTRNAENFIQSVFMGFTFDTSPVANEIAQFNAIEAKYYTIIMNGLVDPVETWAKYKEEAYDVVKVIQEELQKQIDAAGI